MLDLQAEGLKGVTMAEKNKVLTEVEARQILAEQDRKQQLEDETKVAISEARATLSNLQSEQIRQAKMAELKTLKREFNTLEKEVPMVDEQLFATCSEFLETCSKRMSLAEKLVELSAQISKASRELDVRADIDPVFDASLFRIKYNGLAGRNSFSEIYVHNFIVQTHKGRKDLSSYEWLED